MRNWMIFFYHYYSWFFIRRHALALTAFNREGMKAAKPASGWGRWKIARNEINIFLLLSFPWKFPRLDFPSLAPAVASLFHDKITHILYRYLSFFHRHKRKSLNILEEVSVRWKDNKHAREMCASWVQNEITKVIQVIMYAKKKEHYRDKKYHTKKSA